MSYIPTIWNTGDIITAEKLNNMEDGIGNGLTDEVKAALLNCFAHVAWIDEDGQDYYDALDAALSTTTKLVSIIAVFTQGSAIIYDTDSLDTLRQYLVVTANYSDSTSATVTEYILTGTLAVGTSTVTVNYEGKTDTFTVTVTAAPLLPTEYQQVEYIQSTGVEYLDTGVYGDESTSLDMTLQRLTAIDQGAIRAFGSRTGIGNRGFFLSTLNNGKVYIDMGASTSGTQQTAQCMWTLDKVDIHIEDSGYSYGGTAYTWASDHHGQTFTTPDTLVIFNGKQAGSLSTGMAAKLYSIVLKKNGTNVFNGIPCYRKSDNEPGLYDTISSTFLTNLSGSGAFTVGGDV